MIHIPILYGNDWKGIWMIIQRFFKVYSAGNHSRVKSIRQRNIITCLLYMFMNHVHSSIWKFSFTKAQAEIIGDANEVPLAIV